MARQTTEADDTYECELVFLQYNPASLLVHMPENSRATRIVPFSCIVGGKPDDLHYGEAFKIHVAAWLCEKEGQELV
jgi:hypothetical protein